MMHCRLWNETRQCMVAEALEVAKTPWARMKGLLGKSSLEPGRGLLIENCKSVHTCFMKFPIDLVFLNEALQVTKTVHRLGPWRFASSASARHVLELPAGRVAECKIERADSLKILRLTDHA